MFNFFTSRKGADVIVKGWKKAGIVDVLNGTIVLPSEDPFSELFQTLCYVSCCYTHLHCSHHHCIMSNSLMNINYLKTKTLIN